MNKLIDILGKIMYVSFCVQVATVTKTIKTAECEITYTKTANKIHFESVYVEPKFRGQGIARYKIFEIAKAEGGFYLTLDATEKSRKVWRKIGFSFKRGSYFGTMRIIEDITLTENQIEILRSGKVSAGGFRSGRSFVKKHFPNLV